MNPTRDLAARTCDPTEADKIRSRKALNHAVNAGRITPKPCQQCGAAKTDGHHHDYAKPLDVEWLCRKCHSVLHNQKHPLTKGCENCGAVFTPHPTKRARKKTCSPTCHRQQTARRVAALWAPGGLRREKRHA